MNVVTARRAQVRDSYEHLAGLFVELAAFDVDDPRRTALRERLIAGHLPVARHIARRYAGRGQPLEDLEQVAVIGLIGAVDRFDPARGHDFLAFAVPTVTGHVLRYFRDFTWSVRVDRAVKDLYVEVSAATTTLSQELGRAPNATELAEHLGRRREEVIEALAAAEASYRPARLDHVVGDESSSEALGKLLAESDRGFALLEHRLSLRPALAKLPERERTIVLLRFYGNQTQTQIAQRLGISQMHVSRLLAATLKKLRALLAET